MFECRSHARVSARLGDHVRNIRTFQNDEVNNLAGRSLYWRTAGDVACRAPDNKILLAPSAAEIDKRPFLTSVDTQPQMIHPASL